MKKKNTLVKLQSKSAAPARFLSSISLTPPRKLLTSDDIHIWLEKNSHLWSEGGSSANGKVKEFEFEITREWPEVSVRDLRRRFFKYHTDHVQKKGWPRPVLQALQPISLILNPSQLIDANDPFSVDTYYAIYYRRYFVKIERNIDQPIWGPHIAKLYLEVRPGKYNSRGQVEWLGTTTLQFTFDNEEAVRVLLRRAIRTRAYFVSEATAEIMIQMRTEHTSEDVIIA